MKSACVRGSSPAVSFRYGIRSQTGLSQHFFVHRALRQSVRELRVDDRRVSARRAVSVKQNRSRVSARSCCKEVRARRRTKIAVITMRGLISSSIPGNVSDSMVDDMRAALQQAREDSRVKAIVLEIDSPGGEVTASDEIYSAVVKTRARKPVVVYMDSLAASGGYYVSCGGKFLMANETTITGSIGVIIQTLNYEQLFNKIGLASVVFKSGKFKDMLNGARPITPEERELVPRTSL